jgi:hypothetical protein
MTINDFIEILYKNRQVIETLFQRRQKSVYIEQLLPLLNYDNEKMDFLVENEILIRIGNTIVINDIIKDFFEKFTDATEEINNEYTEGLLKDLKAKIEIFNEQRSLDKKDEYLLKIKTDLRKIGQNIHSNVSQIRKNIYDAYITEKNIKIRKIILDENDRKAHQIENLIRSIQEFIKSNEWEFFRKNAEDNTLEYIVTNLFKSINVAWRNLTDIIQKIIDFHNQIRLQTETFKKLQRIKQMKDNGTVKEYTNIENVVLKENALLYNDQQRFNYNISVPFLQSDDGYFVIAKVKAKIKERATTIKPKIAEEVSELNTEKQEQKLLSINLLKLKQQFASGSGELFDFIENYEFEQDITFDEQVTLFCKMASLYNTELNHTGEYKTVNDIEYAVIQLNR